MTDSPATPGHCHGCQCRPCLRARGVPKYVDKVIHLDTHSHDMLRKLAKGAGLPMSKCVERLIKEALGEHY
jgi:hypothetical protein